MADRKGLSDPNETPEDVATLYSWANLHGAKYRDFSASRAQTREKARRRVQEAMEAERRRAEEGAEPEREAQARAEQEASERAAQPASERPAAQPASWQAAQTPSAPGYQPQPGPYVTLPVGYSASGGAPKPPQAPVQPPYQQPYAAPTRDDFYVQPRVAWSGENRETGTRPAWLANEPGDLSSHAVPLSPEDTLQGSRDRITSRWFALKGLFSPAPAPTEPVPMPDPSRAPVLAVFSLAGGVGKTSLVATLGRTLSSRGERVLLVDTAVFGLLPFFFGSRDQRPGVLRTFTPPGNSGDAPIQMLSLDQDNLGPENAPQETLSQEIARNGRNANRIIVDLATASAATARRVLRMGPTILVPVMPDMSSLVSVSAIDSFFQRNPGSSGHPLLPCYLLNQFDPSLPLHLDVREVLRERLGDRLLPFSLRRTPAVSEALAEGMTVVDYAPNSTVAEDFGTLAGWVKSLAAPAPLGFRGVRWSER
jgi:cellulose synthase operon protein YhjQ